jgi:hypothetical protein
MTVEYVFAAVLALSCQNSQSCYWLEPGAGYQSRTPTQNPNWCVINRSDKRAPVMLKHGRGGTQLYLGRGIEPCDSQHSPTS